MVQEILRFYSYAFQFLISLIFLALGAVASLSDNKTFEIDFLPWTGSDLRTWLLVLGIFGLASTYLAFRGRMKFLFLLWTVVTVVLTARAIFASNHQFDGQTEFKWALALLAGVIATALGAWSRFRQPASLR